MWSIHANDDPFFGTHGGRPGRACSRHRGVARGFLPQGLSNTCPQTGVMRRVVAMRGQVSNKPKWRTNLNGTGRSPNSSSKSEFGDSGHSRVATDDRDKIATERPHPNIANSRCRPEAVTRHQAKQTLVDALLAVVCNDRVPQRHRVSQRLTRLLRVAGSGRRRTGNHGEAGHPRSPNAPFTQRGRRAGERGSKPLRSHLRHLRH